MENPDLKILYFLFFSKTLICTWPEMKISAFKALAILSFASLLYGIGIDGQLRSQASYRRYLCVRLQNSFNNQHLKFFHNLFIYGFPISVINNNQGLSSFPSVWQFVLCVLCILVHLKYNKNDSPCQDVA